MSGQAKFCYIGTHFGVDTIRANAGGLSTTATVTWEEPLPQGGLTAAPASVPADNVAFSTVTLSDAPPGHWVHLMATLTGARFVPSRGTVDGNGRFSAVVYSTTAGLATITAYDETEGEAFAAHTCVTFTPLAGQPPLPPAECPSVVIAGVKAKYPLEARYLEGLWAPNVIKVTVSWGAAGPGRVEFTLNEVPTSKPATGPRVSYEFDMGNALIAGQNSLRIVAYDAAGHASLPTNFSPFSIAAPDWLHGLQELGVIGDLVTAGSTRAGWDYTGGVKLPVAPIKVEAPGMSKGPKLEFFVRGSVRMPFTCSTPVRIGAEGGAALSWNMMGLVWGVELKGSGFAGRGGLPV